MEQSKHRRSQGVQLPSTHTCKTINKSSQGASILNKQNNDSIHRRTRSTKQIEHFYNARIYFGPVIYVITHPAEQLSVQEDSQKDGHLQVRLLPQTGSPTRQQQQQQNTNNHKQHKRPSTTKHTSDSISTSENMTHQRAKYYPQQQT